MGAEGNLEPASGPANGVPQTASEILPLVYDELRRLAAARLAHERPGQTLQATALVHEAWLRLDKNNGRSWQNKAEFFAAAAEAMRRILIDNARRKQSIKRSASGQRSDLDAVDVASPLPDEQLLAVDEAIEALAQADREAAQLVKLRFFVGLTHREAGDALGLNHNQADQSWLFAKAWLAQVLKET